MRLRSRILGILVAVWLAFLVGTWLIESVMASHQNVQGMIQHLLIIAATTAAPMLVLWWLLERWTRPLTRIADQVKLLEPGKTIQRLAPLPSDMPQEIQVLHCTIDELLSRQHQHVTDLERSRRVVEETQAELAFKEEQLRLALDSAGVGMWDWFVASGRVQFSDTWWKMLGYVPGELPDSVDTWVSLLHPDDRRYVNEAVTDHLDGGSGNYSVMFRMQHKDGAWRWILSSGRVVIREMAGRPLRFVGTHVDITQLKETQERLEQAVRVKDEFLATMSHEIRTPMNGVIGLTAVLQGTALDDEQRNLVGTIQRSGEALLAILNDVLDMAKLDSGRLELELRRLPCAPAIRDVVALFRQQATSKGIALSMDCPAELWLTADPTRLRQVLLNLVSNAVKFTDAGSVTVRASNVDQQVVIQVQDSGIGIPADRHHRLFQRFSQVDAGTARRFGGTGLGLAICRQLVELMHGTIDVESTEDVGSMFIVRLPCGVETASWSKADVVAKPDRRALVIDDNAVNRVVLRRLLEQRGLAVQVAEHAESALAAAANERPELILLDLHLSDSDGLDLAQRLIAAGINCNAIVLCTADVELDVQSRLSSLGIAHRLDKPIRPAELDTLLARILT